MKCTQAAIAVAIATMLSASAATAQIRGNFPKPAQSTAYDYHSYYAQEESPSDRPQPKPEAPLPKEQPAPRYEQYDAPLPGDYGCTAPGCTSPGCTGGCDSCCNRGCLIGGRLHDALHRPICCCEDAPWRLFECYNESNCRGITATGWIAGGASINDTNPPSNYNGTVTFNDREEVQINQVYFVLERELADTRCQWDWGGRADVLYGTDSRFTEARGLETDQDGGTKWNTSPFYGVALPQLYLEVGYNDLSLKLGHFYTIIGYESVMAPQNFFYSHAYTMQYGEPFTHTGLLASYRQSETTTLMAGFDRGWDNWEDDQFNRLSFLGGINWQSGGTSISLTGTAGQEPTNNAFNDDRFLYSFVYSNQLTDRFTYVFQHDYGFQDRGISAVQDAEWYGVNQYFLYRINCCWTAGVRAEWFRDDDGFRVQGIGDRRNGHPLGNTRFVGDFYELTVGANWSPNSNLIVRPEVRFDWFDGVTNNANVGPFDDGAATDQTMFAIDMIYLY